MADEKNAGLDFKKILLLFVIMVILTAITSYVFLTFFMARDMETEKTAVANQGNRMGPTFNLGEFVVNLSGAGSYQYVQASIVVEVDEDKVIDELEKRSPQIRDIIILTLRDQKIENIEEPGARVIKNQLMSKLNEVLSSGEIVNVWFTQLVVQ